MALSEFASLLGDLAIAFGEPVLWKGYSFPGRFRIDPFVVGLPETTQGIGTTETWLYCERAAIPGGGLGLPSPAPDIGDVLIIRNRQFEIVEVGEDDLGELALRLIKYGSAASFDAPPPPYQPEPEPPPGERPKERGRPTRREEIERAYAMVAEALDPQEPMTHVFPAVRRAITGSDAPAPGLTDKTLGKTLRPLVAVRRNGGAKEPGK